MAKKFQCDVTGIVHDGDPKHVIEAPLTESVSIRLRVFKQINKNERVEMDIGPEGEKKLVDALATVFPKSEPAREKKS